MHGCVRQGKQRQIALVAKLLRQLGGKQMVSQQDRIGRAAAGKDSSGSVAATERLALAWRDALTAGASAESAAGEQQGGATPIAKKAAFAGVTTPRNGNGNGNRNRSSESSNSSSSSSGGKGVSVPGSGSGSGESFTASDLAEQEVFAACVAMAAEPAVARADFAEIRILVRQVCQVSALKIVGHHF